MNSENGHDQSENQLCIKGCGFFGSSATENMCSKCYKDHLLKVKGNTTPTLNAETSKVEPAAGQTDAVESKPDAADSKPARCGSCRKRVGLTGFKCRCGITFCGVHRYPEAHGCSFDYKTHGREALAKANPLVQASKIDRTWGLN